MMGGAKVSKFEIWPERDRALLFCNTVPVTHLNTWLTKRVQVLTDLSSFGYERMKGPWWSGVLATRILVLVLLPAIVVYIALLVGRCH